MTDVHNTCPTTRNSRSVFLGISGMEQIKDRRAETPVLYAKITDSSLNELCESDALLRLNYGCLHQ